MFFKKLKGAKSIANVCADSIVPSNTNKSIFDSFTEQLILGIQSFDSNINNLSVKDCTYRIYRDARFSKDKTPYKTHMGAFISPNGKKSGYSGYYFHIEASKEIILILSEREKLKAIISAMVDAGDLKKPGTGIIFTLPVGHLIGLHHREDFDDLDEF